MPRKDKRWIQKRTNDPYYKRAKMDGYQSRSAYKLLQIQKKYKIFKMDQIVIDLCSAPGGWLQVIHESIGENGHLIGIDISPIRAPNGVDTLQFDITDTNLHEKLVSLGYSKVDVIVSDCAPKTTGVRSMDNARQIYLVEAMFELAKRLLNTGGSLVTKIFQSEDTNEFIHAIKQVFHLLNIVKPPASERQSLEEYLVSKSYFWS